MIPVLPETAPFSAAQRAWLNGFFAGLLGGEPGSAASCGTVFGAALSSPAPAPNTRHPTPNTDEDDFPWHDPALSIAERLELAKGRPFDQMLMAATAQLDCGQCGYMCRTYTQAIARGEEQDLTLCVPGGTETAKKLKELVRDGATEGAAGSAATAWVPVAAAPPAAHSMDQPISEPGYDRKRPFPATVLAVEPLCRPGSDKDVRHVALDLQGSGLTYEVGDALGVFPENCPELVHALLEALGAGGDAPVMMPDGQSLPAWEALLRERLITRGSRKLLALLAQYAADADEARSLQALVDGDPDDFLEGRDLLDLLTGFPSARPPLPELVAALTPLQPRLYSIASSLKAHPGQVHLTVGVVRYSKHDCSRARKGVASTFLAERVASGAQVRVFVQSAHGFRLPASGDTPLIMVGPGTGIAPFRAFLQERQAVGARGKNWLFFGDRRRECDFLYEKELERCRQTGLLTRLDCAFSRDQAEKLYVQHRMQENAAELWAWLQAGAHFYVCGDAQRMARDVDQALHRIVREQCGMPGDEASAYVTTLKREKRYQRDVY
jgi:sulfite reductase (NADPH) flavoprotein alpha-component